PTPRHLGLIQDGHRRYARESGLSNPEGYRAGAAKTEAVLPSGAGPGMPGGTPWWPPTGIFARHPREVPRAPPGLQRPSRGWAHKGPAGSVGGSDARGAGPGASVRDLRDRQAEPAPRLDARGARTRRVGHAAEDRMLLNIGVGYGGRLEILDAIRRYLEERFIRRDAPEDIVGSLTAEALEKYLYTYDVTAAQPPR